MRPPDDDEDKGQTMIWRAISLEKPGFNWRPAPTRGPVLQAALEDGDAGTRELAALGLGRLGDPRAIEPLRVHLRDPEPSVRTEVWLALAGLGDKPSLPHIVDGADEPDADIAAAIAALARFDLAASFTRVVAALDDPRLEVRIAAINGLSKSANAQAPAALSSRLGSIRLPGDDQELDEILIALRQLADRRSEAALVDVLLSDHAHERSHPLGESHGDLAGGRI